MRRASADSSLARTVLDTTRIATVDGTSAGQDDTKDSLQDEVRDTSRIEA